MASASYSGDHFDAVCCVCQEDYKNPKTLSCGHTYCYTCLVTHIKSRQGDQTVQCPKCRKPIHYSRGKDDIEVWVNQLKTDERIANLLRAKNERYRAYLKKLVPTLQNEAMSSLGMKEKVSSASLEILDHPTSDPFLPLLKQIGDNFNQIWEHVTTKGEFAIYPKAVHGVASQISDSIFSRVNDLSRNKFGLCYVARSLAPVMNIEVSEGPTSVVQCDVCIMTSVRSTLVLTIAEDSCEGDQEAASLKYNHALSRGIVEAVLDFTDENFTVINGVLNVSDLQDNDSFCRKIQTIEQNSSKYCVSDSLNMTEGKCLNIVTAFLRAVAVIRNTRMFAQDKSQEELWFLTKEQFMILTEDLGSCAVFVDAVASSGSTVLMLEVANRLEKTGKTMLICEPSHAPKDARSGEVCSKVLASNYVTPDAIPEDITNIVAEAAAIEHLQLTGRSFNHVWVFHSRDCSMCESEGRKTSATSWCEDCDLYLCQDHTHNHHLVPSGRGEKQSTNNMCLKHSNKELEMYCVDCRVAICYICSQTKHKPCQNIKSLSD